MRATLPARLRARLLVLTSTSAVAAGTLACEPDQTPPVTALSEVAVDTTAVPPPAPPTAGDLVFDSEFLFVSLDADSTVLVPWFFRSRVTPEGVLAEQSAWLSRAGSWETLGRSIRSAPATRSPWRIVPGETIRLVVGIEDRIQSLVLRDPPRELETSLGSLVTEWTNPGATFVRLYEGRTAFPAGQVDGFVLEVDSRWEASEEGGPGDWVFLHSGRDLQVFLQAEGPIAGVGFSTRYQGWTRIALRDLPIPDLQVEWARVGAFEAARRDIPTGWMIRSPGGEVVGEVETVASHVIVGQGDGPILPLLGLFEVSGELIVEGREFSVTGMIRHVQR